MLCNEPLSQSCTEAGTEALYANQVLGIFGKADGAVLAESHARNEVMDMGMINQLPGPGVQDSEQPQVSAKRTRLAGHITQSCGTLAKEQVIADALVGSEERTQRLRDHEGHQEVAHGEKPLGLGFQPCLRVGVSTLRACAVPAAVIREVLAAAPITAVKTAAACGGMAAQDRVHGRAVTGRHAAAVLAQVLWTVAPENVGEGHCRRGLEWAGVG